MNALAQTVETEVQAPVAMTPMDMIAVAVQSDAGIEKLDKLMALQERYEANLGRKAFDSAMAAAKAKIPVIQKNRTVDFTGKTGIRTNYNFEDLAGIQEVINPILSEHGLSYRFRTEVQDQGRIKVTCIISHRDGYYEENALVAGRDESGNKNSHQAVASAQTYLMRYTLKAALGLASADDDDGQKADGTPAIITDAEYQELLEGVENTGMELAKLEAHFGVDTLADLPVASLNLARHFIAQKAKQASNG